MSQNNSRMIIVTHVSPDFDAIGSVWLLKRYGGLDDATVMFISTRDPKREILDGATAVVDTGSIYSPENLRFDHHQLPGNNANETCATLQVYEFLLTQGKKITHLKPLIDIIFADDTGRFTETYNSNSTGIHAIIKGFVKRHNGRDMTYRDQLLLEYGMEMLDNIDYTLRSKEEARKSLRSHVIYRSPDNCLWGLNNASEDSTAAAFEQGARLVLFNSQSRTPKGITYGVGIWRAPGFMNPNCGKLIDDVVDSNVGNWIKDELNTWYRHPAGFYAGRGGLKAPRYDPVLVAQEDLAHSIDKVWERNDEKETTTKD